ncbi:hypothetical protein ACROYT_G012127 [Oculina patagonica]
MELALLWSVTTVKAERTCRDMKIQVVTHVTSITQKTYWGGASPGSGKCACGMTNSCADLSLPCNCDKNDQVWREDSGLLTDKTHLPVKQLRFGDTGTSGYNEQGYHTLGKLKCYGIA